MPEFIFCVVLVAAIFFLSVFASTRLIQFLTSFIKAGYLMKASSTSGNLRLVNKGTSASALHPNP